MNQHKYTMSLSLNVLNHLGINLYSNVPAVLSEAVANSWDADAEKVEIEIGREKIVITDDGHGMSLDDINHKYLLVGYERRKIKDERFTPKHHRRVMGRKGIGKLSLFSIANKIEIHTVKNSQKNGFLILPKKIQGLLNKTKDKEDYHPDDIPVSEITLDRQGTIVILSDLKRRTGAAASALRKRLARRFSIIGSQYKFNVIVDGTPISISDRDYFHKLQYLWYYGKKSEQYVDYCRDLEYKEERPNTTEKSGYDVWGWIGSVKNSGDLLDGEDNLNKIVILSRGKLAQEDILEDFTEGGLYSKYIIGEINADFFDMDDKDDIQTSNKQEIIKDDPRYLELREWVLRELKHIQSKWTKLRNEGGTKQALLIPPIRDWFESLKPDAKNRAKNLFGKVNQLAVDEEQKRLLFKYGVLAFESFNYKQNLDALDRVSAEDIEGLIKLFADYDDIEATLYYQITKGRLQVIESLREKARGAAQEKVIQQHLYDHLWLLDPSWDRATETPLMEQRVKTEWGKINAKLSPEEEKGRFDIKYKKTSGKHIIIELKKADVVVSTTQLIEQVVKYRDALHKILVENSKEDEPIEVVCLVGRQLSDWGTPRDKEESRKMMDVKSVRVVLYQELIEDAYRSYQKYLDAKAETGRIYNLIEAIDQYMPEEESSPSV